MSIYESDAVESIDLEPRDVRALTECQSVLEDVGRVKNADYLYLVVSQSGKEYLVDARSGACECPDSVYRNPGGGCKHYRRVMFATGARSVPAWVDASAIDAHLGEHVSSGPRVAVTDGGVFAGFGNKADTGTETSSDETIDRPEDCDCIPDASLPCFACWMSGFETANLDGEPANIDD